MPLMWFHSSLWCMVCEFCTNFKFGILRKLGWNYLSIINLTEVHRDLLKIWQCRVEYNRGGGEVFEGWGILVVMLEGWNCETLLVEPMIGMGPAHAVKPEKTCTGVVDKLIEPFWCVPVE